MKTKLVVGFAPAALGFLILACSSSPKPDPYPNVEAFCTAVAAAICQEYTSCNIGQTACQNYRAAQCNSGTIVVPFAGSSSTLSRTYTSSNVQNCLNSLNGAFSSSATRVSYDQLFGPGNVIDTCEGVFVGSAGNGANCQSNYDCTVSGETCDPLAGQASGGQCANSTQKMLGDACADPGDTCPMGAYCSNAVNPPKCVATLSAGAACTNDAECGPANHCVSSGTSMSCAARGGAGAPCTSNADCSMAAPFCDLADQGGQCSLGLAFAPGAYDCTGYLLPGTVSMPTEAGAPEAGTSDASEAGAGDGATGG